MWQSAYIHGFTIKIAVPCLSQFNLIIEGDQSSCAILITTLDLDSHTSPMATTIKIAYFNNQQARQIAEADSLKSLTIGSSPSSSIVQIHRLVSASHCRIRYSKTFSAWIVEDLSSKEGTYINTERITKARILKHDDRIRLGSTGPILSVGIVMQSQSKPMAKTIAILPSISQPIQNQAIPAKIQSQKTATAHNVVPLIVLIGLAAGVGIAGIAFIAAPTTQVATKSSDEKQQTSSGETNDSPSIDYDNPAYRTTVSELSEEFSSNSVVAEEKYANKLIAVTGVIADVDDSLFDQNDVTILIGVPDETTCIANAGCITLPDASLALISCSHQRSDPIVRQIQKGNPVEVRGIVYSESTGVHLKYCQYYSS